jgi:hypothetical protein
MRSVTHQYTHFSTVLNLRITAKLLSYSFNVHGSVHRKNILIYIQQDATLHSLFISGNCSTCLGWYHHPSSGAQTTVSTASGICHTVIATCRDSVRHPQHTQTGSNSSTIAADRSNGVTNTRRCRYSCMRSWWWVEVPPEICRTVSRYKWTV